MRYKMISMLPLQMPECRGSCGPPPPGPSQYPSGPRTRTACAPCPCRCTLRCVQGIELVLVVLRLPAANAFGTLQPHLHLLAGSAFERAQLPTDAPDLPVRHPAIL